jgi:hypothetical protein
MLSRFASRSHLDHLDIDTSFIPVTNGANQSRPYRTTLRLSGMVMNVLGDVWTAVAVALGRLLGMEKEKMNDRVVAYSSPFVPAES